MLPTVKGVIGDAKTYPKKLPEVATFNYQSAHKVNFSKALEETNWKEELGPAASVKNFSRDMDNA